MALENSDLLVVQRPGTSDLYKLAIGDLPANDSGGGDSSVIISEDAPDAPSDGQLWWCESDALEGGGRLYIYTGSEWVDISQPGGGSGGGPDAAGGASVTVSENAPVGATEGDLWYSNSTDLEFGGRLYIYIDGVWVDASLPGSGGGGGESGSANITVSETPPSAEQGSLWWANSTVDEGGGRLYIYLDGQWVDTSLPGGGGGFSGDYNDLTNKPNIPEGFDLEDGSEVNNLIVWRSAGEAVEISLDAGATDNLNTPGRTVTYTDMPTQTNGSGTGLTVTYTASDAGVLNIFISFPGSGYEVGDTFQVFDADGNNRGFGGAITETSSTAGDHPGPDGTSGWYPEEGSQYYVSTRKDSSVVASPRFLGNTSFGARAGYETLPEEGYLSFYGIGGRPNPQFQFVGNGQNSNFQWNFYRSPNTDNTGAWNIAMYGDRASNGGGPGVEKTKINLADRVQFDITSGTGSFRVRSITNIAQYIELDPFSTKLTITKNNSAINFSSTNGKYNFKKSDGTSNGYIINAETGSAAFILPEDSADPANYDAEGEYIGPLHDPVANLQETVATLQQEKADLLATVNNLTQRLAAIESNEIADDAIDTSLLSLVASLTERVAALEGGNN